jgi:transcriptional regulator with XRE-family HTH domain
MGTPRSSPTSTQPSLAWAQTTADEVLARQVIRTRVDRAWPRVEFIRWLDQAKALADIPNDITLARKAGVNQATIAKWRTSAHSPALASLIQVARVLRVPVREIIVKAGILTPEQLGPGAPADDADALARALIAGADLPEDVKTALTRMLTDEAAADVVRRRRLVGGLVGRLAGIRPA